MAHFDCLHDMGDPIGAARHVRQTLAPDGIWMIVEPFAGDNVEDNLNPIGRIFYSASTMLCVPSSLSERGPALGAQAGEARLRSVVTEGGLLPLRRATETPFNLVLEARPQRLDDARRRSLEQHGRRLLVGQGWEYRRFPFPGSSMISPRAALSCAVWATMFGAAASTRAADICGETVPTNRFIDGIPAYAQCAASMTGAIFSDNGVDTSTMAVATGWVRTQGSDGYQCTELAYRYLHFRWGVQAVPNGTPGSGVTPPSQAGSRRPRRRSTVI